MNTMDKITILLITADPSDATRLRLGEELREIQQRLQLGRNRDCFLLDVLDPDGSLLRRFDVQVS